MIEMPRPWFRATTREFPLECVINRGWSRMRTAPLTDGERALGWLILPPFQRPAVWTVAQQVRFIESAWAGLPLGVWVFNRPEDDASPYANWLLDGQQRITAIMAYATDSFRVHGALFSELTARDRRKFEMGTTFPALETNISDPAELEDVYDRLAYGGTPHEPKP